MTLTQSQLDALNGNTGMTPNQSSTILGHSTGLMENIINGAENLLPTAGAILGGIGGAAAGGIAGIETGPGAVATAYAGGVAGTGAGAAGGEALKEKLQGQSLQPGEIAKQGGINAAFEAVGGPILSVAGKAFGKVANPIVSAVGKGASKVADLFGSKGGVQATKAVVDTVRPPLNVATNRVASTADIMTRKELAEPGRVAPSGKVIPSATEKRAGEILKGKTYGNPVKTQSAIKDEVATRGKEAETYLEKESTKITNKEDFDAFQSARSSSEKYMTPAEAGAYDEQIGVFQKILKGYTGEGGYNTANYYKALKEYESQVTANLPKGKDALLVPGGSARIQGAKDIRTVVRDMIGEKNPEFKGKMFDLASLYDAMDNVSVRVAEKAKNSTTFAKRHPIITKGTKYGAEAVGAGLLYEGAKNVGAPLP